MVREHLEFFLMKMLLEKIIQDPYVVVNMEIQLSTLFALKALSRLLL
jgi:hypothetical protein